MIFTMRGVMYNVCVWDDECN